MYTGSQTDFPRGKEIDCKQKRMMRSLQNAELKTLQQYVE